jgi:hypothetical protein
MMRHAADVKRFADPIFHKILPAQRVSSRLEAVCCSQYGALLAAAEQGPCLVTPRAGLSHHHPQWICLTP